VVFVIAVLRLDRPVLPIDRFRYEVDPFVIRREAQAIRVFARHFSSADAPDVPQPCAGLKAPLPSATAAACR
jgi:hypothetical protein